MPPKVKAFTLQELLMVMLLTSLLISALYTGFSQFMQYYYAYIKKQTSLVELNTLQSLLYNDFQRADTLYFSHRQIAFEKGKQTALYQIDQDFLIRKQSLLVDTFWVHLPSASLHIDTKLSPGQAFPGTKQLSFTLETSEHTFDQILIKQLSAQELLSRSYGRR